MKVIVAMVVLSLPTALAFGASTEASSAPPFPPPSAELVVPQTRSQPSLRFHPAVVLRDKEKQPVATSGGWVSFTVTCGQCHDATWIGLHGYHFRVGLDERTPRGKAPSGRPWDFGPGLFGRWDPLNGYDSVFTDASYDEAAIDRWVLENRPRLLGGGPATLGTKAQLYEPNCALCHVRGSAVNQARSLPLAAYQTATLERIGLVTLTQTPEGHLGVIWKREAFSTEGSLDAATLSIQRPTSAACGNCHGFAASTEPRLSDWGPTARLTETTGQLFLASRMSDSTLNLTGRAELGRPWDVHAERLVDCTDCHFSPNDPSSSFRTGIAQPEHLKFEARQLPLGEYLRRPSHELAKGHSTQGHVADAVDGTMRRCEDCHDAPKVHRWLPKAERHLTQVGCETCHISTLHVPARQVTDYTVVSETGQPRVEYRGIRGTMAEPAAALTEYRPLLLRRKDASGLQRLLPYNIITSFYWVVDDITGPRPAPIALLKRAFYETPGARENLAFVLDRNHNGKLEDSERSLVTAEQVERARALLTAAGAKNPRIVGELQPYGIHHGVAPARFALRDCNACHAQDSGLAATFELAEYAPFGVVPTLLKDSNIIAAFDLNRNARGRLLLRPNVTRAGLHVFGLSRAPWLDTFGLLAVGLVLMTAFGHGAMRVWTNRQRAKRSS